MVNPAREPAVSTGNTPFYLLFPRYPQEGDFFRSDTPLGIASRRMACATLTSRAGDERGGDAHIAVLTGKAVPVSARSGRKAPKRRSQTRLKHRFGSGGASRSGAVTVRMMTPEERIRYGLSPEAA